MNTKTRSRFLFPANIGLVLMLLSGCSAPGASSETQAIAFTHVNLIPMTSEKVIPDQTVLVKGTEIVAIGDSDTLKIPRGDQVIDGKSAYLMPGLTDMHIHTMQNWDDQTAWSVNPLRLYLANGVTTLRDNGPFPDVSGDSSYLNQWQDEIRAGSRIGPTLYTSGVRPGDGSPRGSGDPVELVRWNHERGFDFLKIYSLLSVEDFQAAMKTAKELGMYTTGHIPWAVGLDGVLAEGMDEIAHVEELEYEFLDFDRNQIFTGENFIFIMDKAYGQIDMSSRDTVAAWESEHILDLKRIADQIRTAGVPVCTTLAIAESAPVIALHPEAWVARPELKFEMVGYVESFKRGESRYQVACRRNVQMKKYCENVKYEFDRWILSGLHEAGVQLLLGSDTAVGQGIVAGFSIHDELRILVENGFTPYEALLTGTVSAARVVEKMTGEGNFGTIEVGNRADLILVRGNPLEDIAVVREPLGVMAAGRWYSAEALAELIEIPGSTK
jgi:imidazolonepropionase-like amidohydrolase